MKFLDILHKKKIGNGISLATEINYKSAIFIYNHKCFTSDDSYRFQDLMRQKKDKTRSVSVVADDSQCGCNA